MTDAEFTEGQLAIIELQGQRIGKEVVNTLLIRFNELLDVHRATCNAAVFVAEQKHADERVLDFKKAALDRQEDNQKQDIQNDIVNAFLAKILANKTIIKWLWYIGPISYIIFDKLAIRLGYEKVQVVVDNATKLVK